MLKKLCSRFLAGLLAASTVMATVPAAVVYAAPESYQAVNTQISDPAAVSKAVAAAQKARRTGAEKDIQAASELLAALRPVDRLKLYVELIRDYYLKNYRNKGFKYFDAKKYLAANEDVRLAALLYSPDDMLGYALKHYLEQGIFEGRSSETAFDPMVAILARPEILFDIIISSGKDVPDVLHEAFIRTTGKTTTDSYQVLRDSLVVIDRYVNNAVFEENEPVPFDHVDNSDDDDDDEEEYEIDFRVPNYINSKSMNIDPYVLYRDSYENAFFSFRTYNPLDDKNNNQLVNVRFRGENYRRAKEIAQGKKYTLMLYFCGTNLEEDAYNRSVTGELVSLMQADMSNVNVILCVGGTLSYGNSLMNRDSEDGSTFGASNLRSGIYYLNPDALSSIRDRLMKVNTDKGDAMYQLAGTKEGTDLSQGLHFDDIITSDSFIQLVSTSAVDMADPSFLAGFINLSTNLFPAENYGLTLSNHGGGLDDGVIFIDSYKQGSTVIEEDGITVYELESALASTDLYRDKSVNSDGKLGFIYYNACLMGSTGQAYNTKDYFRYMIASEECSSGHTAYRYLVSGLNDDVAKGRSDREIAIHIAEVYEKYPATHHGFNEVYVGSIAVFSSEEMTILGDNINDLSRELSQILGTDDYESSGLKHDVFMAIRKASLACYPTHDADLDMSYGKYKSKTDFVDIGELMTHIKYYLGEVSKDRYSASDLKELDRLESKLDKLLNAGFLEFLAMYNTDMGGIYKYSEDGPIPLNYTMNVNNNIWTDIRANKDGIRDYLYGSSIYMPLNKSVTDYVDSDYYKYYKDTDLNYYVVFINDYLNYYNDDNGYAKKISDLKDELWDIGISKLVTQTHSPGSYFLNEITDDDNNKKQYLSFKIADSYAAAGLATPAHSTGSLMLDLLETQPQMTLAAVHKEAFTARNPADGTTGVFEVSMICAEEVINPFAFSLDNSTISFDVSDATKSIINGITLEGKTWNRNTGSVGDYDWQFVLGSSLEYDSDKKDMALKTLFNTYDSDATFLTVFGSTLTVNDEENHNITHIFMKNDDGDYDYCGSVKKNGNDYIKIESDNVIGIAGYHYILVNDGEGETHKEMLEDLGIDCGYFAVNSDNKPILYTGIQVVEKTEDGQYSGRSTGYAVNLSGDCQNFSVVGDIGGYENAVVNVGNGPLAEINYSDVLGAAGEKGIDIVNIGRYVNTGNEYDDTERSVPGSEPEQCDSLAKRSDDTEDLSTDAERFETYERASADGDDVSVVETEEVEEPAPAIDPEDGTDETDPAGGDSADAADPAVPAPTGNPEDIIPAPVGDFADVEDPAPEGEPAQVSEPEGDEAGLEEPSSDDQSSDDEGSDDSGSEDSDDGSDE